MNKASVNFAKQDRKSSMTYGIQVVNGTEISSFKSINHIFCVIYRHFDVLKWRRNKVKSTAP